MKGRHFSAVLAAFAATASLAIGPCDGTTSLSYCPDGTEDDGSGTNNCVSTSLSGATLSVTPPIGQALGQFFYMGFNSGFTLGNGGLFTTQVKTGQRFDPDLLATFGKSTLPNTGGSSIPITEGFTAVAVYSAAQGARAGVTTYDGLTNAYSDLTGYIVAVGYSLTPSGSVVPLIARYTPRGVLDPTFNNSGYVLGTPGAFTGGAFALFSSVAIDSYGRIVVGGYGNTQPHLSNYLTVLQTQTGDPTSFDFSGVQDSLQAIVARFSAFGSLDTDFDTTNAINPPRGSALKGFATSPRSKTYNSANGGFTGASNDSARYDVVLGVGVDSANGIYAVGGTSHVFPATYQLPFIAHYSASGVFDSEIIGSGSSGSASAATLPLTSQAGFNFMAIPAVTNGLTNVQTSGLREYFSAIKVDQNGRAVVAGISRRVAAATPLVARFQVNNVGRPSETLALDTTFDSDGIVSLPANGTENYVTSIDIDTVNGLYVLAGRYIGVTRRGFINTVNATTGVEGSPTRPAAYIPGADQYYAGAAVLTSEGVTTYFAVGSSTAGANQRSVVASFSGGTGFIDTNFASEPYADGHGSAGPPIIPAAIISRPIGGFGPTLPSFYDDGTPGSGRQLGPDISGGNAFGGGIEERFTGVTRSADGTAAIVVGFTTVPLGTDDRPTTGRSFPILLIYKADGTFPNMADYTSYYSLQNTF